MSKQMSFGDLPRERDRGEIVNPEQTSVRYWVTIIIDAPCDSEGHVAAATKGAVRGVMDRILEFAVEDPALDELAEEHGLDIEPAMLLDYPDDKE
jgi:hypothetical protein